MTAYDLTAAHDPEVAAIPAPSAEAMAAERERREAEALARSREVLPPDPWLPGDETRREWCDQCRAFEHLQCDPLTGELLREADGRPVRPFTDAHDPASDPLRECVATFRRWLHMPDPGVLLVTLATVAANRADGDPVWLLVVGPPGSGKTEALATLSTLPDVHAAATLTEASLLSGTSKRDKASDAKGGLLREVGDFGIIVCKDFGSILSMNRDARAAVLAALREVYDGSWTRHVGTDGGRTLAWSGKVGLLAGCTPAIDSHHAVIGSMGERFVLYRLPPVDAAQQARRALSHVGKERAMRQELGAAVSAVLDAVSPSRIVAPPAEATIARLVSLASLAVRCRSAVERDGYSREVLLVPEAEAPGRLALVLLRLLNGLRAIGCPAGEAWRLVTKSALDCMPALRRSVLDALMARTGPASTTEIAEAIGYPSITARRALEDLAAHGILVRDVQGQGKADLWHPSDWTREEWPTVSEMSGDVWEAAGTVSEMSGDVWNHAPADPGTSADAPADRPYSSPTRVHDDFSEKVPPGPSPVCDCGKPKVSTGDGRYVCTNPACPPRRVCPSCKHPHPVRTSCADCPDCRAPSAADDPPWPATAPVADEPVEVTL